MPFNTPIYDPVESERLWRLYLQTGTQRDAHAFLFSNIRLIYQVLKRYLSYIPPQEWDDYVSVGWEALLKALDRYDVSKGVKFSTYASFWVRQMIGRAYNQADELIRLPSHISEDIGRLKLVENRYLAELGSLPDIEELASLLDWPLDRVLRCQKGWLLKDPISLDQPIQANEAPVEHDRVSDYRYEPFTVLSAGLNDDDKLGEALRLVAKLDGRTRQVLDRRYLEGQPFQQIGEEFEISRERVRQIESRAVSQIRVKLGLPAHSSIRQRQTGQWSSRNEPTEVPHNDSPVSLTPPIIAALLMFWLTVSDGELVKISLKQVAQAAGLSIWNVSTAKRRLYVAGLLRVKHDSKVARGTARPILCKKGKSKTVPIYLPGTLLLDYPLYPGQLYELEDLLAQAKQPVAAPVKP